MTTELIYYVQLNDLTGIIPSESITEGFPFEAEILRLLLNKNSEHVDYQWDESYCDGKLAKYTIREKLDSVQYVGKDPIPRDIYVIQPEVEFEWHALNSGYITE